MLFLMEGIIEPLSKQGTLFDLPSDRFYPDLLSNFSYILPKWDQK